MVEEVVDVELAEVLLLDVVVLVDVVLDAVLLVEDSGAVVVLLAEEAPVVSVGAAEHLAEVDLVDSVGVVEAGGDSKRIFLFVSLVSPTHCAYRKKVHTHPKFRCLRILLVVCKN